MSLPNLLDGTERFMTAASQPIPEVPALPSAATIALRLNMLLEEVGELAEAIGFTGLFDAALSIREPLRDTTAEIQTFIDEGFTDIVEIVDAYNDTAVIAWGGTLETAGKIGAKLTADEVTRSNLDKIDPISGECLKRTDGKILKPASWIAPDIAAALTAAGWKADQ